MSESYLVARADLERDPGLYSLFIDGAKLPNSPGQPKAVGAIGAVLDDPRGNPVQGAEVSEKIAPVQGPTTAEYTAFVRGLELARERGIEYIAVFSDSRTLVNQINKLWRHNTHHLEKLCSEARDALSGFRGSQVSWIPREWNSRADDLAGRALRDGSQGSPTV